MDVDVGTQCAAQRTGGEWQVCGLGLDRQCVRGVLKEEIEHLADRVQPDDRLREVLGKRPRSAADVEQRRGRRATDGFG